jgi:predicted DNA-binding ribbon-helix-helix protein
MERKTTSIKIEPQLWKDAKKYAIDKNMSLAELIEKLLKQELGKK